jgi:hypothetical protein
MTRCTNVEEFVAGYSRFAGEGTLFVVTKSPRPVGPARPFLIQLVDGTPVLSGTAEVVESHSEPTGPSGMAGMKLRLVEMDATSRDVHRRLVERNTQPPARVQTTAAGRAPAEAVRVQAPGARVPTSIPSILAPRVPTAELTPAPVERGPAPESSPLPASSAAGSGTAAAAPSPPSAPATPPSVDAPRRPSSPPAPAAATARASSPPLLPPSGGEPRGFARAATAPTVVVPPLGERAPSPDMVVGNGDRVAPLPGPTRAVSPTPPRHLGPGVVNTNSQPGKVTPSPPPPSSSEALSWLLTPDPLEPATAAMVSDDDDEFDAETNAVNIEGHRRQLLLRERSHAPTLPPMPEAAPQPHPVRPPETRAPGSPYILPANPLAELEGVALERFVECTLVEHTDRFHPEDLRAFFDADAAEAMDRDPAPDAASRPDGPSPSTSAPPASTEVLAELAALRRDARRGRTIIIAVSSAAIAAVVVVVAWSRSSPKEALPSTPVAAPPADRDAAAPAVRDAAVASSPSALRYGADAAAASPAEAEAAPAVVAGPLAPGKEPPPVAVTPGECRASIHADTGEVVVRWAGRNLGNAPLREVTVPCGPGEVELSHPRYQREVRPVEAIPGTVVEVSARMKRPEAVLVLQSSPPGAKFTVNGRRLGSGAKATVQAFESVTVSADLRGYETWKQKLYVKSERMTVAAPLVKSRGSRAKP